MPTSHDISAQISYPLKWLGIIENQAFESFSFSPQRVQLEIMVHGGTAHSLTHLCLVLHFISPPFVPRYLADSIPCHSSVPEMPRAKRACVRMRWPSVIGEGCSIWSRRRSHWKWRGAHWWTWALLPRWMIGGDVVFTLEFSQRGRFMTLRYARWVFDTRV